MPPVVKGLVKIGVGVAGVIAGAATGNVSLVIGGGLSIVGGVSDIINRGQSSQIGLAARAQGALAANRTSVGSPVPLLYGKGRLGSIVADYRVDTSSTQNRDLYIPLVFCHGSRDGYGIGSIDEIYFDDKLAVDANGVVQSPWTAAKVKVTKLLGTSAQSFATATINSTNLNAVTSDWTTNDKGGGMAGLVVYLQYDQNLFPNGVPTITAVVKGNHVEDPRSEVSGVNITFADANPDTITRASGDFTSDNYAAGDRVEVSGSSSNDGTYKIASVTATVLTLDSAETLAAEGPAAGVTLKRWAHPDNGGDNPALCIRDYCLSTVYGPGLAASTITWSDWAAEANFYDESVARPGTPTTETRFTTNGWLVTSRSCLNNLNELLTSCRGSLIWQGSTLRLHTTRSDTSSGITLDDTNIIGGWTYANAGAASKYNVVRATYLDEVKNFRPVSKQWPEVGAANSFLTEDNSFENRLNIDLPFTNSPYMAARISEVRLKESRQGITCEVTCTEELLKVQIGDIVEVTHETPAWSAKEFWVAKLAITPELLVRVTLVEYDSSSYSLTGQTEDDSEPDTDLPNPFGPSVPTLALAADTTIGQTQPDGTYIPRIKVTITAPTDATIVDYYIVKATDVSSPADSDFDEWGRPQYTAASDVFYISPAKAGVEWTVRVWTVNVAGITSTNYASATVTPDFIAGGGGAIVDPIDDGFSATQNAAAPETGNVALTADDAAAYSNLEDANTTVTTYTGRYGWDPTGCSGLVTVTLYTNDGAGSTTWTARDSRIHDNAPEDAGDYELYATAAMGENFDLKIQRSDSPAECGGTVTAYGEDASPPGVEYDKVIGTVPVTKGGTGQSSLFTVGDVLAASATDTVGAVTAGATTTVLVGKGAGVVPAFEAITDTHLNTDTLTVKGSTATYKLQDTDESLPAGLWRWQLRASDLFLERNTAAGGDFSTVQEWLRIEPIADGDGKYRLWLINDFTQNQAIVFGDGTATGDPNKGGNEMFRLDGTSSVGGILANKSNSSTSSANVVYQARNNNATDANRASYYFSTRVASQVTANLSGINAGHIACLFENRYDDDPGASHTIRGTLEFATANDTTTSQVRLKLRYDGHLIPAADSAYDLGLTGTRFRYLYVDDIAVTNGLDSATVTTEHVAGDTGFYTYQFPAGGAIRVNSTPQAGAIKITLPVSWTSTMLQLVVDVYDYGVDQSGTFYITGYNYATSSQWYNPGVHILGATEFLPDRVRFGHDGTKCCIVLGETSDSYAYPKVVIREVRTSHLGADDTEWKSGWAISFESDVTTGYTYTQDRNGGDRTFKEGDDLPAAQITPGTFDNSGSWQFGTTATTNMVRIVTSNDVNVTDGLAGLYVGASTGNGQRIEIDANEIASKSNDTTAGSLYLNHDGGNIYLAAQSAGAVWIGSGSAATNLTTYGYIAGVFGTIGLNGGAEFKLDGVDGSLATNEVGFFESGGALNLQARGSITIEVDRDGDTSGAVLSMRHGGVQKFSVNNTGVIGGGATIPATGVTSGTFASAGGYIISSGQYTTGLELKTPNTNESSPNFLLTGKNSGGTEKTFYLRVDPDGHLKLLDDVASAVGTISQTGVITDLSWNGDTIGATYGGTGQTSWTRGDLVYANSTTTLAGLTKGSDYDILVAGALDPSWVAPADLTGVNADTVDTLHAASFLRSDTADEAAGVITFSAQPSFTNAGAPFLVSNSTVVANLNADLLDGSEATAFGKLASANTWTADQTIADGDSLKFPEIQTETGADGGSQIAFYLLTGRYHHRMVWDATEWTFRHNNYYDGANDKLSFAGGAVKTSTVAPGNGSLLVRCLETGGAADATITWSSRFTVTFNGLAFGTDAAPTNFNVETDGDVTFGTWKATTIGEAYGGTAQTTYTKGDILYSDATNSLSKLGVGAGNTVLFSNAVEPSWYSLWTSANPSWTRQQSVKATDNYVAIFQYDATPDSDYFKLKGGAGGVGGDMELEWWDPTGSTTLNARLFYNNGSGFDIETANGTNVRIYTPDSSMFWTFDGGTGALYSQASDEIGNQTYPITNIVATQIESTTAGTLSVVHNANDGGLKLASGEINLDMAGAQTVTVSKGATDYWIFQNDGDLDPAANVTYNIGHSTAYVKDAYLSVVHCSTVIEGQWNATAIGPTYGGTNQTTWTTGDLMYASAANTLAKRAVGSTDQVLTVSGGVPVWADLSGIPAGDATTLDGLDSTQFLRSDADDTMTGDLRINGQLSMNTAAGANLSNGDILVSGVIATSDGGAGNIDHIWHDDTGNVWNFCSDTTRQGVANSTVKAATLKATSVFELTSDGVLRDNNNPTYHFLELLNTANANACELVVLGSTYIVLDSNNNQTTNVFGVYKDATTVAGATELFTVNESGLVEVPGYIDIQRASDNLLLAWDNTGGLYRMTTQGGVGMYCDSSMLFHAGDNFENIKTELGIEDATTSETLYLTTDGNVWVITNRQGGTYGAPDYATYTWQFLNTGVLRPTTDGTHDLGDTTYRWQNIYTDRLEYGASSGYLEERSSGSVNVVTASGWCSYGCENTSWAHFYTDRAYFYMNKGLSVTGALRPYNNGSTELGDTTRYFLNAYAYRYFLSYNADGRSARIIAGTTDAGGGLNAYFFRRNDAQATSDSGTVTTGGSTTTFTDSSQSWTPDEWNDNYVVEMTGGTYSGTARVISDNTATTLTFAAFPGTIDVNDTYVIRHKDPETNSGNGYYSCMTLNAVFDNVINPNVYQWTARNQYAYPLIYEQGNDGRHTWYAGPDPTSDDEAFTPTTLMRLHRTGYLWVNSTLDADVGSFSGILRLGSDTGNQMLLDANEIMAKTNATTAGDLYLQVQGGRLYIANSTANMVAGHFYCSPKFYCGGELGGGSLATPGTPTVTPQGTGGSTTWGYKLVALNAGGFATVEGAEGQTTTGNATLDGTNFNRITWTAIPGAHYIYIYLVTGPIGDGYVGSVAGNVTTFDHNSMTAGTGAAPSFPINRTNHTFLNGAHFRMSRSYTTQVYDNGTKSANFTLYEYNGPEQKVAISGTSRQLSLGTPDFGPTIGSTTGSFDLGITITVWVTYNTSSSMTFDSAIKWAGGTAPTPSNAPTEDDCFVFKWYDSSSEWRGFVGGLNF